MSASDLSVHYLAEPPAEFLAGETEGREFYLALQHACLDNFEFGYFDVRRGSRTVAIVPWFVMRFSADTTIEQRWLKPLFGWIRFRIACVGNPSADLGMIDGEVSAEVLAAVNAELSKRAGVVAYKDLGPDLPLQGFGREPNLPVAVLDVQPDFFATRSAATRRNFRRKLRAASAIRIEEPAGYPRQHAARIYELYLNAYNRADMQFEKLTPLFFENMAGIGKYVLYWEGDCLIGFSLLICRGDTMVAKYMGMDYERGYCYGLYFRMLLNHIEICIRDGHTRYQTGATAYSFKERLGSRMLPTWIYFTHPNPLIRRLLAALMHLVAYKP